MKRLFSSIAAGLALAACGGPSGQAGTTPSGPGYATPSSAATPSPTPAVVGASVGARMTTLGQILVDSRGISLYLFEADRGTSSACYRACAQNWPPLLTHGAPVASGSAARSLLSTTTRTDGTTQVTYNGHPLYFFVGDHQPGDATGEGINAFGGGWDVLSPSGNKIEGGRS